MLRRKDAVKMPAEWPGKMVGRLSSSQLHLGQAVLMHWARVIRVQQADDRRLRAHVMYATSPPKQEHAVLLYRSQYFHDLDHQLHQSSLKTYLCARPS